MKSELTSDVTFREMTLEDIPEVSEIEKESFQTPWSEDSFISELLYNQLAWYFVLEYRGRVVAYGGLWTIAGEGHITNIAVRKALRGHGMGRFITVEMIKAGEEKGCTRFTLEVRPANTPAVKLYESLGFKGVGVRPRYYQDTGEDALIMWREPVF